MSVLEKTKTLYEVLLRFGVDGKLAGAHAQYLDTITEDGVVISATPGHAIPLSLVEAADKATLTAALGEASAALLNAKEAAEAEVASLRAEMQVKDATAQSLLARVAELETKPVVELEGKPEA